MIVTAGGGTRLEAPYTYIYIYTHKRKGFTRQLQQNKFIADVIVLPLLCCDLILSIQ